MSDTTDATFNKLIVTDTVGIGTERPEPDTQLHISATNKDGKIYLESGGSLLQVSVNSTIASIGTTGNCPLQLQTNLSQSASSGIYLSQDGSVGVGTTSPKFALDVQGTQGIINAKQFYKGGAPWKVTGNEIESNTITAANIQNGAIAREKLDPSISFDPADGAVTTPKIKDSAVTAAKIADGSVGTAKLANSAITTDKIADKSITEAKLNFSISPGSSQWEDVDGDSISYTKGNVGIGTKKPQDKLEVNGSLRVSAKENNSNALNFKNDRGFWHISGPRSYEQGNNLSVFWNNNSNFSSPYLTVSDNGNVGIGTNNPQDKLDVAGNLRILTDSNPIRFTSAWSGFPDSKPNQAEISNDTGSFKTLMIIGNKSAGGVRRVSVWDYLQVNGGMDITGNVGIGTSDPQAKLHVAGNLKLGKGIAVDEFVFDIGTVQGDGKTSVPTVSALRKAVNDVKEELSKQFQKQIQSLQQQNQLLQQQNQSLTTDLQNTKNELNQLKNQVNRVRPASVIAVNSRNEWFALRVGQYNTGDLESSGIRNDQLASLFIPPRWKVSCYRDSNFQGPLTYAGPFDGWAHVPDWLGTQVSSIIIQAT